ncbi:MAG: efflux RND transporter periplasmic adaptor subunit [Flavobacteriales bacterium]|jgi:cobalt-zinc-cadmium efflux system membrane fusion protein|nr:efflux RND transporter periplasmic adaptor subunit [Flavobacteriales bacterium]
MKYIQLLITTGVLLSSCLENNTSPKNDHNHNHENHGHHEENSLVELTEEQLKLMQIEVGVPEERYISTSIKSTGVLELPPQNKASLSAIAEGRVKSIHVTEGVAVRKGEVLALVENTTFIVLQQEYLTLKQKGEVLRQDVERKTQLQKDSIVALKVLQEVIGAYENNQIKIKALIAQMDLLGINREKVDEGKIVSHIPIKAPINGYVRVIKINMNAYVHPGDVLFEIVDNEHLHIDLMVFEKDIPFIRKGQRVTFSMAQFPNKIYEASVFAVGKALEEEQRAMRVHAELIEEYHSLLPGMYVDATIHFGSKKELAIPTDAFVEENGMFYVFIKKGNHQKGVYTFNKVAISKGKTYGGYSAVKLSEKLKVDSEIVTKGAFYLLAEQNKEAFEHSH